MADYFIKNNPYGKKDEYSMPKEERHSNNLPVKNDSVSPQTYDCLTGKGYVDVKYLNVLDKMTQRSLNRSPSMAEN